MRVTVLLEQCLGPVPGGTGRYSREVAAALARRAAPGDSVAGVVAWHRDPAGARVGGVLGPHRLPLPRRVLAEAWSRGLPPGVGGDVVHAPTPLAPRRGGRPLVVTVHDAVPWTDPGTLTARGVAWHRRAVAVAARTADAVVVPTRAVADELAAWVPLGDGQVRVVGEGVARSLAVPPDAGTVAARLGLPEEFLLTVATLEPRKGLADLIAALGRAGAPDLPLLCVGQPGWGGTDPLALAAAAGLPAGRVRVLGRVPDAELAVLMSRATAVVVPSRSEGFGLPLLEAMSLGTPVLTSEAPALVEVAGGAALAVPVEPGGEALAAGLARITGDSDLRRRLAVEGPRRAAAFTWDGAADELWSLYRELSGR